MPEVDLADWCTRTRDGFQDWEDHEMGMFPSPADRDLGIVEWVVRVLGNPELPESRAALRVLLARHRGTPVDGSVVAAARADYEAYQANRKDPNGLEDYVSVAESAAKRIPGLLDEIERLHTLADDVMRFRDSYRDDLDAAEENLDKLRADLDRAEVERDKLREDLADAKHEREVLREGAADLDERLQLALKDEGRARADYDAAALLLGRALVERDGYRAQAKRMRSELAEVTGQRNDAVDLAITLTSNDGQVA